MLWVYYAVVCAIPSQTEVWSKLLCCYYSADIRLLCGCYHTMLIVSNFEISWKLWNLVKMLKSSPLVQKHGMAEGPYTCWDKFCTFLLRDLVCNWVENFATHFPSKYISYKERLMSKIHEKVLLHYRKSEKAENEVHPLPSFSDRSWHLLPIRYIRRGQFQY